MAMVVSDSFYIDCEFDGHGGPLISLALVREDGRSLYIRIQNIAVADPWVAANVLPVMDHHFADVAPMACKDEVGSEVRKFIGDVTHPTIIADSPVDIGRFCTAVSTSPDGKWASTDFMRITFEVHNVDCYPTDLPGAVQHNAWWDAMALRSAMLAARKETGHE